MILWSIKGKPAFVIVHAADSCFYYKQETEDHAGGRHSVHLYQHALQSHGTQHPARHQGAAGAHAGCGAQVGHSGLKG